MIKIKGTGYVYKNPIPHVYSRQATHPSIAQLPNGDLLAGMCIGQAFEAVDCKAWIARSSDMGDTWNLERKMYEGSGEHPSSESIRISCLSGETVAYLLSADRSRTDDGLCNPDTLGFVETEFLLMRSGDNGKAWSKPVRFEPPLTGPAFEICCPIVELSDGRWILPTQTWAGWDGCCPNGYKMVAFVSNDRGNTWPEYMEVMSDPDNEKLNWESKIVELSDKRLLAVSWCYNRIKNYDLPNQYTISSDGGKTFVPQMSTGLNGQTMTPFVLKNGKILTVYRRMDKKGLWANISRIDGNNWINEEEAPLWGVDFEALTSSDENMARNFQKLKFGAPSITRMADGTIILVFWCVEDDMYNVKWIKLEVNE